MSSLPQVSGREVVAALAKIGFEKDRQKGSHIVLRQVGAPHRRLLISDHDDVTKGTLRAIIKQADFTVDELIGLL